MEPQITKKVKILDADVPYTIDELKGFFETTDDVTMFPEMEEVRQMKFSDFKFTLGPKQGDFSLGDKCRRIITVKKRESVLYGTVEWYPRKSEQLANREYPTNILAKLAPRQLIKFYKSKIVT